MIALKMTNHAHMALFVEWLTRIPELVLKFDARAIQVWADPGTEQVLARAVTAHQHVCPAHAQK